MGVPGILGHPKVLWQLYGFLTGSITGVLEVVLWSRVEL